MAGTKTGAAVRVAEWKQTKNVASGKASRTAVAPLDRDAVPDVLDGSGRALWGQLTAARSFREDQRGLLVAYVVAQGAMVVAATELTADGVVIAGYRGSRVKHPAWQIYREATATMTALAKALGIGSDVVVAAPERPSGTSSLDELAAWANGDS